MEIDFLGLNSSKYSLEQEASKNVFTDTGGVEISLSLSTSSPKQILNFSEKKKTWEFLACDKMNIPSCSGSKLGPNYISENSAKKEQLLLVATPVYHRPAAAGFLYDLNDAAVRSNSDLQTQPPTSALLYHRRPSVCVFNQPEKADKIMHIVGNPSTRLPRSGYTPTVAMARRATLARFLEKRSHRMNQGRTSPLMGKPPSVPISEACDTSITISNKKRNNNLNLKLR